MYNIQCPPYVGLPDLAQLEERWTVMVSLHIHRSLVRFQQSGGVF